MRQKWRTQAKPRSASSCARRSSPSHTPQCRTVSASAGAAWITRRACASAQSASAVPSPRPRCSGTTSPQANGWLKGANASTKTTAAIDPSAACTRREVSARSRSGSDHSARRSSADVNGSPSSAIEFALTMSATASASSRRTGRVV